MFKGVARIILAWVSITYVMITPVLGNEQIADLMEKSIETQMKLVGDMCLSSGRVFETLSNNFHENYLNDEHMLDKNLAMSFRKKHFADMEKLLPQEIYYHFKKKLLEVTRNGEGRPYIYTNGLANIGIELKEKCNKYYNNVLRTYETTNLWLKEKEFILFEPPLFFKKNIPSTDWGVRFEEEALQFGLLPERAHMIFELNRQSYVTLIEAWMASRPTATLDDVMRSNLRRYVHKSDLKRAFLIFKGGRWFETHPRAEWKDFEKSELGTQCNVDELQDLYYRHKIEPLITAYLDTSYWGRYYLVGGTSRSEKMFSLVEQQLGLAKILMNGFRSEKDDQGQTVLLMKGIKDYAKEIPGLIDFENIQKLAKEKAEEALAKIKEDRQQAVANRPNPFKEMAKMAVGLNSMLEFVIVGNALQAWSLIRGNSLETSQEYAAQYITKQRKLYLEKFGYVWLGDDETFASDGGGESWYPGWLPQSIKENSLKTLFNVLLGHVSQSGNAIQSIMQVPEFSFDTLMQTLSGMSAEEYSKALSGKPQKNGKSSHRWVKQAKTGFYILQGFLALSIIHNPMIAYESFLAMTGGGLSRAAALYSATQPYHYVAGISLGMSAGFTGASELYTYFAEPSDNDLEKKNGKFSISNFLKQTAIATSGTLVFMGGVSALSRHMTKMNYSPKAIANVTNGIDATEGTGDISHTLDMLRNHKGRGQLGATLLTFIMNIWDSGDAAGALALSAVKNGGVESMENSSQSQQEVTSFKEASFKEASRSIRLARLVEIVRTLERPLQSWETEIIRAFPEKITYEKALSALQIKLGIPADKAVLLAAAFSAASASSF